MIGDSGELSHGQARCAPRIYGRRHDGRSGQAKGLPNRCWRPGPLVRVAAIADGSWMVNLADIRCRGATKVPATDCQRASAATRDDERREVNKEKITGVVTKACSCGCATPRAGRVSSVSPIGADAPGVVWAAELRAIHQCGRPDLICYRRRSELSDAKDRRSCHGRVALRQRDRPEASARQAIATPRQRIDRDAVTGWRRQFIAVAN